MKKILKFCFLIFLLVMAACSNSENKSAEYQIEKSEAFDTERPDISEVYKEDVVGVKLVDNEMDEIERSKILFDGMENVRKNDDTNLKEDPNEENVEFEKKLEERAQEDVKVIHKPLQAMPDHRVLNDLLNRYVSDDGKVNYKGISSEKGRLEEYITELSSLGIQPAYSKNDELAFWINLYNACTLDLILENYPLKSITDINDGKPWDLKVTTVNGKSYSLNKIENDLIRPTFKEPRIHFALNCAAVSCPKLMNSAFEPAKLEAQLSKMTRSFLNNSLKNQISNSSARVSKIFDWYKEDFNDLRTFINKYSSTRLENGASISFNEYDWSLNE